MSTGFFPETAWSMVRAAQNLDGSQQTRSVKSLDGRVLAARFPLHPCSWASGLVSHVLGHVPPGPGSAEFNLTKTGLAEHLGVTREQFRNTSKVRPFLLRGAGQL